MRWELLMIGICLGCWGRGWGGERGRGKGGDEGRRGVEGGGGYGEGGKGIRNRFRYR